MYNLLISGNDEAWENGYYELEASRFLEYTSSEIAENFKPVTLNKNVLLNLPCLFGYEGTDKPYRYGYLTEIINRDKKILIKYKIESNIEMIPFTIIQSLSTLLDIRDWEINRTHWAVKDGDLIEILDQVGYSFDDISRVGVEIKKRKMNLSKVKSVTGFIQKVFNIEYSNDEEIFYRGHSRLSEYKLEPSLFRKDKKGNYLYLQNENILYKELLVSNSVDFTQDTYTLDKLVRMQHYSLPTRMLDITSSPLIALYFACKSCFEVDGEVIIFTIEKKVIKYFDSDTASCIANLARLPQVEKEGIDYKRKDFNDQDSIKRLVHLIREEKPYFDSNIKPNDLQKIICVKSKMTNSRIVSQSGSFLLFGHDAIMDDNEQEGIIQNRITVSDKEKILKELDRLNINERTVFPYIENSAKYIRNKYSINI